MLSMRIRHAAQFCGSAFWHYRRPILGAILVFVALLIFDLVTGGDPDVVAGLVTLAALLSVSFAILWIAIYFVTILSNADLRRDYFGAKSDAELLIIGRRLREKFWPTE